MPLAYQDVPARLRQRCCLICGYDGPELQGDTGTYRCPACDADLYARPPRSYAELEGFIAQAPVARPVDQAATSAKARRPLALVIIARVMRWLSPSGS